MPDERVPDDAAGLRAANARLRELLAERDAEVAALLAGRDAERELIRRLGLRLAELERRLGMDSTDSGTPSSKERIGAKEARRARRQSERERSKDRRRGGQPGHQGKGPQRDPDPGDKRDAAPSAECRSCRAFLDGAEAAGSRWAQVVDVEFIRTVTEWALPGLLCPCCGAVTFAEPPPGAHQGSVSYEPAYASKLRQAGVPVIATRYQGIIHDFVMLNPLRSTQAAEAAITQAISTLRRALHAG